MSTPPDRFSTLTEYAAYANTDWMYPRDTLLMQQHIRGKLREEAGELCEAIHSGDPEAITDEAGDFVWLVHAAGSNTRASLERSFRTLHPDRFPGRVVKVAMIDKLAQQHFANTGAHTTPDMIPLFTASLAESALQLFINQIGSPHGPEGLDQVQADLVHVTLLVSNTLQTFANTGLAAAMKAQQEKIRRRNVLGLPVTRAVLNGHPLTLPDEGKIIPLSDARR